MCSDENLYEPEVVDPHSGARPLLREHASTVLERVLRQCSGRAVVFDLDSTLLNNRPRSAMIMREFARDYKIEPLTTARANHWQDWSAATAMANIGLDQATIASHIDEFEGYWRERFFTSEYCTHDEPLDGAVDFVNSVERCGGRIIYLTGRPTDMHSGTIDCFRRHGFPLPISANPAQAYPTGDEANAAVTLIMKPRFDGSDDEFKQQRALELNGSESATRATDTDQHSAAVAAVFDNEPQHINTYNELMAGTECIHLFTDHSMRAIPLQSGIPSIRDFTRQATS